MQVMGIGNCSSVLPIVASDCTIVYRERFAGMYSSWPYSFSQVNRMHTIFSFSKSSKGSNENLDSKNEECDLL